MSAMIVATPKPPVPADGVGFGFFAYVDGS
jgi:hypothetical protein